MASSTGITRGSIFKYALLPGILPRIGQLLGSGFHNLAYFIAVVFNTLRIIPNNHPYLKSYNHGQYSVLQVLRLAADNITFDRKNIDKVTIFFVVIGGLVMMALQLLLCILAIFTGKAMAAPGPQTFGDFFDNPNAQNDIAFRLLDLVFGVPDIFNSKDMETTPFHSGFHALLQFYSFGILLIGTFVIIYLVTTVVLETAQEGTPFGERFNKAWAPVRLILFFGLLLPATHGLNLAQYLVLESAKLGSNVATNGWLAFDDAVNKSPYLGAPEELIASPQPSEVGSLISFMQLARTCQKAEGATTADRNIKAYAVFGKGEKAPSGGGAAGGGGTAQFYEMGNSFPSFAELSKQSGGGSIFIRFGVQDAKKYANENGTVFPFCGELSISVTDMSQPGAAFMQQAYMELVSCFWSGKSSNNGPQANYQAAGCSMLFNYTDNRAKAYTNRYLPSGSTIQPYASLSMFESGESRYEMIKLTSEFLTKAVEEARQKQIDDGKWVNDAALELGWAGAGIWFNKIAEQNGAFTSAIFAKPEIQKMPHVMEMVRQQKLTENADTPLSDMYTPSTATRESIKVNMPNELDVLTILNHVFKFWSNESTAAFFKDTPAASQGSMTGNAMIDIINLVMGTSGLFDMCKNTKVHPLAQLTSLGKGLVDHSIYAFGIATGFGLGTGLLKIFEKHSFAAVTGAVTQAFMGFAGLGLILGFLLFYVIPFMPFIYFFFAVMTWVKGIFEAMVAMPLWALAHLHIDGQGMPGDAASAGYFHILEIFLRPICILIGFLGGIAVFAAMVKVMNQIFYVLIANLTGHDIGTDTGCFAPPGTTAPGTPADPNQPQQIDFKGNTVDEFFYTVMYAIIVYMFAVPCFKLVDMVPDNIMRWLGAGISSFGSQDGDPAEGLMTHVSFGAGLLGSQLQGGLGKAVSAFR